MRQVVAIDKEEYETLQKAHKIIEDFCCINQSNCDSCALYDACCGYSSLGTSLQALIGMVEIFER